jgi:hypothetical protein
MHVQVVEHLFQVAARALISFEEPSNRREDSSSDLKSLNLILRLFISFEELSNPREDS